jgi:hypothetical protein
MKPITIFQRVLALGYALWFVCHFIAFFSVDEEQLVTGFWPFTSQGASMAQTYDITEFLVYVIGPLIPILIYRYLASAPEHQHQHNKDKHKHTAFLVAFLDEKIKAEQLQQQLNRLNGGTEDWQHSKTLLKDRDVAASKSVKNWLEKRAVIRKYKDFEHVEDK